MTDNRDIDINKVQPAQTMRIIEDMVLQDMSRYSDPKTGLISSEYGTPVTECYCCKSSISESKFLFNKYAFPYYQCNVCDHVYVSPRLNDSETYKLYNQGRCLYQLINFYIPSAPYRKEKFYIRKLKEIEELIEPSRLLDFGCSSGYFLDTAINRGWNAFGIELNKTAVNWAREKLKLKNIFDLPLEECNFDPEMFNVITLWDVLEHLSNPLEILSKLHTLLKSDGILVVETSKYDCFETEILGQDNTNLVGDMHLMHFTEKSLTKLLGLAGFSVLEMDAFGLDLKHIEDYFHKKDSNLLKGFGQLRDTLQNYIDSANKGCYLKCICKKL